MADRFFVAPLVWAFLLIILRVSPTIAQVKITIGHAAISPRIIPLVIAQERGIFAKHGIDTRLVLIKGAPILVTSLISGDIDLGYTGGPAVLGAAAQGVNFKILASVSSRLTHTLIASPNIKRAEDLRGKKFGIQSIGGSTWMHTMLGLEYVGIDPKRDNLSILVIGDSVLIGQALEAGRIDAAVLDGVLARRLKGKGFSVIAELQPANIPMLNQGIVVTQDYLQRRSEVAEKVLMALVESLAFSLAPVNKPVVLGTLMKRFKIADPGVAEEGYQDYLTSVERKPYPSVEALRNIQRLMALYNPKVAAVRVEDLIETRFIRKLDEGGFIEKASAGYGMK